MTARQDDLTHTPMFWWNAEAAERQVPPTRAAARRQLRLAEPNFSDWPPAHLVAVLISELGAENSNESRGGLGQQNERCREGSPQGQQSRGSACHAGARQKPTENGMSKHGSRSKSQRDPRQPPTCQHPSWQALQHLRSVSLFTGDRHKSQSERKGWETGGGKKTSAQPVGFCLGKTRRKRRSACRKSSCSKWCYVAIGCVLPLSDTEGRPQIGLGCTPDMTHGANAGGRNVCPGPDSRRLMSCGLECRALIRQALPSCGCCCCGCCPYVRSYAAAAADA